MQVLYEEQHQYAKYSNFLHSSNSRIVMTLAVTEATRIRDKYHYFTLFG